MKLWILLTVISAIRCVTSQNVKIDKLIEELSKNLSKAFTEIRTLLSPDEITQKIKSKPKPITETVALEILQKSKVDTETLVSQTSEVVDKIQAKVTTEYDEYAKSSPPQNAIECSSSPITNMFYFRAKAIRNGPYELQNCSQHKLPLTNDSLLDNLKTSRQNSTVHVPTNVYDFSKEIQNVANYTENVDKTFALSVNKAYIKWQFFCSDTGFFRIFPGIRWHIQMEDMEKDNTKVDFFDCRSEQWFLESTSYPKKMIIMVDKSGSMKGRRRIIANHTIYEILNTMTENDYFNVLLFTKEITFADNRTKEILMQATEKNKRFIMEQLESTFIPDGIAEYDIGLTNSLRVLQNERNRENGSTVYNYLVMIISDGSPLAYQEVIKTHNAYVQARIFTYLIGQASTERDIVKQMACNNRGYAVEIATLADVKENVQKYLKVVARPNAIMRNAFYVWTGVHQYQMRPSQEPASYMLYVSSQQLGMTPTMASSPNSSQSPTIIYSMNASVTTTEQNGTMSTNFTLPPPPQKIEVTKPEIIKMFVTVSKAAYDISNETAQKNIGNLLGAAGVDVPISDFIKTAPFWKIGVNSYLFGVTHNGFVIFHPRFRPQDNKYVKYFYRNVDISELEVKVDDNITEIMPNQTIKSSLRDQIISVQPKDQPRHLEKRATYDIVDDYKTAFETDRNYYIAGIQGTSYKFGLAVPVNEFVSEYEILKEFGEMNVTVFAEDWLPGKANSCQVTTSTANQNGLAMKEYEFCHLNTQIADLLIKSPLCLLREIILNEDMRTACLQIPDGKNSTDKELETYIKSIYNEAEETQNLQSEWPKKDFLATRIGAQQIFSMHHFGLIRYYNYKNLSYEQFIPDHNAAMQDSLYQETVLTAQAMNNPKVLVVRPLPNNVVKKTPDESVLVFTVTTPLEADRDYKGIVGAQIDQQFYAKNLLNISCVSEPCLSCNNISILDCYVITGSGLIVWNNLNVKNIGELLKEIDCVLMQSLVKNGMFKNQSLYDFQAMCTHNPKVDSFAGRLIDPFSKLFRLSIWLIYEIFLLLQNLSLSSLLWSFTFQQDSDQFPDLPKSNIDNNDLGVSIFTSESPVRPLSGLTANNKDVDDTSAPAPKSKRQHEMFVKSKLEEKISFCEKNSAVVEEFPICIQKAVTDICKLDKVHNGKQSDQYVDKLTPLNVISHCVTVCLMLQSDYPAIWQEQDDCRHANYMCRTVTKTFTALNPSQGLEQPTDANLKDIILTDAPDQTYFQYRQAIITDGDNIVYPVPKPMAPVIIRNGTICADVCPAKTWYATPIANTNLILVLVHKRNPTCSCECHGSFGLKTEITRNTSNSIENPMVQQPNYFSKFVNFTKEENSTDCSDDTAMSKMPLRWLITVLAASFFLFLY